MTDVIVIGAGIAGLACADRLRAARLSVRVLEARHRIGGRVHSVLPAGGGTVRELGAQVVHGERNPLRPLLGAALVPDRWGDRAFRVHTGTGPQVPFESYPGVPPWAVEHRLAAAAPDDLPIGDWLGTLGLAAADRVAAAEWFGQQWAGEPDQLCAGGVAAARRRDRSGPGVYTVDGGYRALADRLAGGLDVQLSRPVARLRTTATGVDADGQRARAAVVAVPPGVVAAGGLVIDDLPAGKLDAARRLRAGDGIAVLSTVDRPAPEAAEVFDATGTGGFTSCVKGDPVTLTVAKGRGAATVRRLAADRDALAAALGTLLPWAAGARVERVRVADWGGDPWARGAFGFPRVGADGAGAVWARPLGRSVFFAADATEVGTGPASVHGALASGIKAAGRVLEALR